MIRGIPILLDEAGHFIGHSPGEVDDGEGVCAPSVRVRQFRRIKIIKLIH